MAQPTVLIVDDSQVMRLSVRKAFEKQNFSVIEAENGDEALKILQSNKTVTLILSDFNMPVMNGLVLVERIRKQAEYSEIPIIMLTAQSSRELVERGKRAGISGWIIKPIKTGVFATLAKKYG